MTNHYQVYENGKWVECSLEYFESFKGEKRHGPYGRESYVYTDAGRTTHSTWLETHRYVDNYI